MYKYVDSEFNNEHMHKLAEYVENNIYAHDGESPTLPFDMDIIEVQKWNELYTYCDNDFIPLVIYCAIRGLMLNVLPNHSCYASDCKKVYINDNNKYITNYRWNNYDCYGNTHHMYFDEIIKKYDWKTRIEYSDFPEWRKISTSKKYIEQEYIDYFISNDFSLNKLRTLLLLLTKNLLELRRKRIDDGLDTDRLVEYNLLLQKYCEILIINCNNYIKLQQNNLKIPLTI